MCISGGTYLWQQLKREEARLEGASRKGASEEFLRVCVTGLAPQDEERDRESDARGLVRV